MNEQQKCPELLVEQLALGELSPVGRQEELERWGATPAGRARLVELRVLDEEILARYPVHRMVAAISERAEKEPGAWSVSRLVWGVSLAASAVLVLIVVAPWHQDAPRGPWHGEHGVVRLPAETVRIKGDSRLLVHLLEADSSTELEDGDEVKSGDVLQLEYVAGKGRYGVVVSMDGRGGVTLHYPVAATGSTALEAGGPHALPRAYELDDAPGFETFYLFVSAKPLVVEEMLNVVRALPVVPGGKPALGPGVELKTITMTKQDASGELTR